MSSLQELQALTEKRIDECYEILRRVYPNVELPRCRVEWVNMGRIAGQAHSNTNTIKLSPALLVKYGMDYIKRTPGHEVAHLVDAIVHPFTRKRELVRTSTGRLRLSKRSVHGPTWQHVMRLIGQTPSRCHQFDTTEATTRRRPQRRYYVYACQHDREYALSSQRHKKAQSGVQYFCKCVCGLDRLNPGRQITFKRVQIGKQQRMAA